MITPRPDKRGISGFFTFFSMPGPLSCFENIHSLRPGQILDIRLPDNRPAIVDRRSYYDLEYPEQGKERIGSIPDLADEFEKVLYASVERRLRADVPVVSYLSGGVDSGIVVAMGHCGYARKCQWVKDWVLVVLRELPVYRWRMRKKMEQMRLFL